jgi:branched-chain amino acid transport system permease protein
MSDFWVGVFTEVWIWGLLASSVNLVAKWGVHSLGQSAFFGLAAYSVGYASTKMQMGVAAQLGLGIGVALLSALLFGILLIRVRGLQFILLSLAFSQLLYAVSTRWFSVTGGDNGLPGVSRPDLFGLDVYDPVTFHFITLSVFVPFFAFYVLLMKSSFGLALDGIRENEARAVALGYKVATYKYAGFVIAGLLAAVAGILRSYQNGFVGPQALGIVTSSDAYLMMILGGELTIVGPLLGAAILVPIRLLVSQFTEYWIAVIGAIYVLTGIFAPDGVIRKGKALIGSARKGSVETRS